MSEEEKVGTGIDIPEDQESHDEWTPAQEKALAGGWNPNKDEWEGDPDEWVDAPEFNRRGDLMARISQLGRKLGESSATIEKLSAMVAANEKITNRMITDQVKAAEARLKAQRREAIRDGDFDTVDAIEESMEELRESAKEADEAPAQDTAPQQGPDLTKMTPVQRTWYDYVTGTPWLQENKELHDNLLSHAEAYLVDNPTSSTGDFMAEVVSKASELRGGKRRVTPRGPDDGKGGSRKKGGAKGGKGKYSAADLNSQQKAIAAEFMEDGIIDSLDEYANMMGDSGHLDNQR
jgi:uncharacterized coiled-coil protein SlyX